MAGDSLSKEAKRKTSVNPPSAGLLPVATPLCAARHPTGIGSAADQGRAVRWAMSKFNQLYSHGTSKQAKVRIPCEACGLRYASKKAVGVVRATNERRVIDICSECAKGVK